MISFFFPKCCTTLGLYLTAIWNHSWLLNHCIRPIGFVMADCCWCGVRSMTCLQTSKLGILPSYLLHSTHFPNPPKQPMHSKLHTPLCTLYIFTFLFQMEQHTGMLPIQAITPCQNTLDWQRNDSYVVHLHNFYSFSGAMLKFEITNTLCDKEWQVNDALLRTSIVIITHDKVVPKLRPVITKEFMFENDVHTNARQMTEQNKHINIFLCMNFMFNFFMYWTLI